MRLTLLIVVVTLLAPTPVSGQAPAAGAVAPRATPVTTPVSPVPPLEPHGYDYDPSGRRDPFISLVRRTTAAVGSSATMRPRGVAGLGTDEIVVRGVMQGRSGWAAVVKGVDNRSYTIKAGDELFDGTVKSVNGEGLTVLQNINDPMSTARTREVKKLLRPEAH